MSSAQRRYGGDNLHIDQNKGKGCAKKMKTQLEKEPEKRKIDKIQKPINSESAIRNIDDSQQNETNFLNIEKGQKVAYNSLIHSINIGDKSTPKKNTKNGISKRTKKETQS